MRKKSVSVLVFSLGLFSLTQIRIIGYLGISELVMFLCAPFVFFRNFQLFKSDGFIKVIWFGIAWLIGAVLADLYNRTYIVLALKGIAVPLFILASIIFLYPLLRRNISSFKWFILGVFFSSILSVFVMPTGSSEALAEQMGTTAAEAAMEYKLFWVSQVGSMLTLPIRGWYMSIPPLLSTSIAFGVAIFALVSGGRSDFLAYAFSALIIFLGGRTPIRMARIKKHFFVILAVLLCSGIFAKFIYSYTARAGLLGDGEREKYVLQSRSGGGIMSLLIAGRSEFFIAIAAAIKSPIFGYGSHPPDIAGFRQDYIDKYGTEDDKMFFAMQLANGGAYEIPSHSHIACFWLWHGIFGLSFWVYVLYLLIETFRKRLAVYPPLFGVFALGLPFMFWAIFFSPCGNRVNVAFYIVICYIVSVYERKPYLNPVNNISLVNHSQHGRLIM